MGLKDYCDAESFVNPHLQAVTSQPKNQITNYLLNMVGAVAYAEAARQLAYRLYTLCERQGGAEDARAYNELITSWPGIEASIGEEIIIQSQTTLEI